ncbi:MAG: hypothetical protein U0800_17055 [Isosphaeraceae bacterium]
MSSMRRGGIPGPESRTGLVRPAMSEAEFERRQGMASAAAIAAESPAADEPTPSPSAAPIIAATPESEAPSRGTSARGKAPRARSAKPRRVQRMFAIEEDLDKKLWLYAIHVGKDRSDVVNDLLRPIVASMVLYDSRDRRAARSADPSPMPAGD